MDINRSKLREIIMTSLYQILIYKSNKMEYNTSEIIKNLLEQENAFVNDTVNGVLNNIEKIDEVANKYLIDWEINRLGKTDQSILRIGIYEILYTDTPDIVCINEAVELAKKYSDDKVKNIINGVLDKIVHNK